MADYISREALLEDIDEAVKHRGMGEIIGQTLRRYILRQPVADVVEVVRCGNCKSSEPIPENSGFYKGNWLHCRKWRGEFTENVWHPKEKRWKDWSVTTPEGFCDDGEARDENKEDG